MNGEKLNEKGIAVRMLCDAWDEMDRAVQRVLTALPHQMTVAAENLDHHRTAMLAALHSSLKSLAPSAPSQEPDGMPGVEAVARAIWEADNPIDGAYSGAAPRDWDRWPDTGKHASLAQEDRSRDDYRKLATAIRALFSEAFAAAVAAERERCAVKLDELLEYARSDLINKRHIIRAIAVKAAATRAQES